MNLAEAIRSDIVANGGSMLEHDVACAVVKGADALDLLHRISTNDLLHGSATRVVQTVFTTEKGRIIALAEVVVTPEKSLLCCSAEAIDSLLAWIEKYTIIEDIHVERLSSFYTVYKGLGGNVASLPVEFDALLAPDGRQGNIYWGPTLTIWPVLFGTIPGVRILAEPESRGRVEEALEACRLRRLDDDRAETLRILEGVPGWGREITHERNPLEIGLRDAVSFTKGCYIGQEVIARLDAYEKVQRELAGLEIRPDASQDVRHEAEWDVYAGDEGIGRVTSVSVRLDDGSRRALGVIRMGRLAVGERVTIRNGNVAIQADVVRLWPGVDRGKRDDGR